MVAPDRSDDMLMEAYVGGDNGAFDELFERHRRPLFTFLLHQTGSRAMAEDLFQEIFLKLIRSRAGYAPSSAFRSWLFTIAHNALTDHRRRSAFRETVSEATEDSDMTTSQRGTGDSPVDSSTVADPVGAAHARDLGRQIEEALRKLP